MESHTINMPLLGDSFPEMTVNTTHGPMNIPGDLKGNWFVLFSHPADFTPVCTTEFVAFQKRVQQFDELNTKLVGMSVDQVFSHIKWVEWINDNLGVEITFPIIAANDAIAAKLGMLHPGKGTNTVVPFSSATPTARCDWCSTIPRRSAETWTRSSAP